MASLILTQPSIVTNQIDYEREFGIYNLDLQKGDPSKNLCEFFFSFFNFVKTRHIFSAVAVALNYYEGMTQLLVNNAVENCTHIDFGSKEVKAPYGWCKMPVILFLNLSIFPSKNPT